MFFWLLHGSTQLALRGSIAAEQYRIIQYFGFATLSKDICDIGKSFLDMVRNLPVSRSCMKTQWICHFVSERFHDSFGSTHGSKIKRNSDLGAPLERRLIWIYD